MKGEHILLREYAFVSATQLNRKCFLQQIRKVFHSTPYYHTITGLDYHQMICLICSDFPRNLMIETIKTLPLAGKKGVISQKNGVSKHLLTWIFWNRLKFSLSNLSLINFNQLSAFTSTTMNSWKTLEQFFKRLKVHKIWILMSKCPCSWYTHHSIIWLIDLRRAHFHCHQSKQLLKFYWLRPMLRSKLRTSHLFL